MIAPLSLIALCLVSTTEASATTNKPSTTPTTDGGIVWCEGAYPGAPNYGETQTVPYAEYVEPYTGVAYPATIAPDGLTANPIPAWDTWDDNSILENPVSFGGTAETAAPSTGDADDRYAIQLDYWNSVATGEKVQSYDLNAGTWSGYTTAGALGYSTGNSCELFYYNTGNIGQFTITYPAAPSAPIAAEESWVTANGNAFPYNGNAPYSLGSTDGGPTGYVSTFKGCSWDANSCTAGSKVLGPGYTTVPTGQDWNQFPQLLSTLSSIPSTYNIAYNTTYGDPGNTDGYHIWDASYDIWFDKTGWTGVGQAPYGDARGQNDGLEIMVWLNSNSSYVDSPGSKPDQAFAGAGTTFNNNPNGGWAQPSGIPRDQVLINNVVYDVWTSRLNNAYYGYLAPGATAPSGYPYPASPAGYAVVPGGADQDTCSSLTVNGGNGTVCGTEWNVVSFVATKYKGTDYRGMGMSMDTKVFTDYIQGIPDGLWSEVSNSYTSNGIRIDAGSSNPDGVLGCPSSSMNVQSAALTSSNSIPCLQPSWLLMSIDAGFEPWEGGNGLEVSSFQAHAETTSTAVQSGVISAANGNPVVYWQSPFDVVFPGCPVSGATSSSGAYEQVVSGTSPTVTIEGVAGASGTDNGTPFTMGQTNMTWLGPGNFNQSTFNIGSWVAASQSPLTGAEMTWNPTENMYVLVVNDVWPINSDATLSGQDALVTISADCAGNSNYQTTFDVFIDPSGRVVYNDGKTPVQGATVTLKYSPSNSATGPFNPVPNNNSGLSSDIMDPADNTLNSMSSTQYGNYAWDVSPGYYEVTASMNNCGSVTSPVQDVVSVPITNLTLELPCAPPAPVTLVAPAIPATPTGLAAEAVTASQLYLTWQGILPPLNAPLVNGWTYTIYETSPVATTIATGVAGNGYLVTGLNPNTAYTFTVVAVDQSGSSPQSSPFSVTTKQSAAGQCHVTYTVESAQPGVTNGLDVNINITNTGTTAIYPWTLSWAFPGNQQVTSVWNTTETQSGENVSLSSTASWESIPAGGTLTGAVGFNGTFTGTNTNPTQFYLNGLLCQ